LPFSDPDDHLRDIYESVNLIAEFVKDMNFEPYLYMEDRKTQAAVERKMAVISEAAVRLRDDAERLVPEIPWRDIRGIGNWLRHQ
jgi:uncharacterized protein with HEPN domain